MSTRELKPTPPPHTTRYEFFEPLGTGATGTVYRARDLTTDLPVAVKVLRSTLYENPTQHHRLAQEFRASTQLEHPNIVRALAMETDGSTSFLVYEFVPGVSLAERIEKEGPLAEDEAIRIVTQIVQALHYAHQRQIVHRDVKPDNILLLADGRAKLTDFGLAKDYNNDQNLTQHVAVLGTPNYMAPEQFGEAKSATPLCDVYSLGATLYTMVTGKVPFEANWPLAILTKKLQGEIPSARAVRPEIGEWVDRAIFAALNPKPALRPESCLAFFKYLTARPSFDGEDLEVTPAAPLTRDFSPNNRRASVRHKLGVGTSATVDTGGFGNGNAIEEEWPLVVRDVSVTGLGVLLARRFEAGTELMIELADEPSAVPSKYAIRVVRVRAETAGLWIHGCEFVNPLGDGELSALLAFA
ncbi:serine threonine protein kinase : Putative serine/threonine protein kinase OS=Gemmata sp. Wa1-1 PE=4 SV=1: Pkinase: PilZ [Gemmataceae bacterium]|nr:serine threonine protein kinase : Putative serine/threonine protein kinase OS=Gemmata sp. Wa1-1 PE=4 SV=1: Pkinase: PilZ [Gemmataceae bacterium]VTT99495.1 serine threonine protein kinase : Putative serine/threonine protein kinase OS=Gemmata sp. Wa1-1 PE=4 SV=1: Pkinase: PilZ [Gemmataceae bacterium]